jgi:hypothetical protein
MSSINGSAMIDPPVKAFRRRAMEMRASATREKPNDLDSSSLIMFYAAECALKYLYMIENGLTRSCDARGGKSPASDFKHNLRRLIEELKIPRSTFALPTATFQRTNVRCELQDLHQAWRYGEKVIDTNALYNWLERIVEHCEKNA